MQTGVISTENVAQILRNIAQKRQNGSLEILQGEEKLSLIFFNGKIVDAFKESENSVARAARRLEKAGEEASEDHLRLIMKHDVLNFLFNLDLSNQSIFNFKNYMPEFDKNYAANISIGQYLLDKASLDAESKKFNQIFNGDPIIMKLDLAGLELTEDEKPFYSSLKDRERLSEMMSSSMFSRYHQVVNLLSFYERAVIEIERGDREVDFNLTADRTIINILEDSSERPFVEGHLKPLEDDFEEENQQINSERIIEARAAVITPDIKIEAESKQERIAPVTTKKSKKFKEQEIVPQICLGVYIVVLFSLIALTWKSFFNAF